MKTVRFFCFVLPALLGCSSGPVDLGDPGTKDTPNENDDLRNLDDDKTPGDPDKDPGTGPGTLKPASGPEPVLESAALTDVGEIHAFDLADGKLIYSALHHDRMALFRYDISSKSNALVDPEYGGSPFAADAGGLFYFGLTAAPVRKAIVGMPLTSTTHVPEWFSSVSTIATAVALDAERVYFIERGELETSFMVAGRGAFATPPSERLAYGRSVPNDNEYFRHLVVDDGVAYAAGDRGRLVKFDLEIATTILTTGGPETGFVVDGSRFYWVDGTDLKTLSTTAAAGTTPTVIATLPSGATNILGGVGPKGVYVLSQPTADADGGKVLRIHVSTGAPTELATKLSGLRSGTFLEKSLYFATSKGVLRLTDG